MTFFKISVTHTVKSITHFIFFFSWQQWFHEKKCLHILPVNAITVPIGNNSSTLISTFGLIKSQNWNSIGYVIGGNSLTKDLLALIFQGWRCNNNSFIRKPNYIGGEGEIMFLYKFWFHEIFVITFFSWNYTTSYLYPFPRHNSCH